MPVFVFNIIYKPLLTSGTRVFLFNIILTEVDTFTSISHHYSNAITQFITQFITQIPLLKSLLIITQMSFSLLIITPPLLKGHFADVNQPVEKANRKCCAKPDQTRKVSNGFRSIRSGLIDLLRSEEV